MYFFPSREVAVAIGPLSIHWYGIMYLMAFVVAHELLPRLQYYTSLRLTRDQWSSLLTWAIVGVIVGGRLGFVIFYEPTYFIATPFAVLKVWEGGMSSHGGFIGVITLLYLYCRKNKIDMFALADCAVIPTAIGLALGRIGNFINLELYGTVTDLPWGIAIPNVEGLRHPTQIYAVLKDLTIAAFCFVHLHRQSSRSGQTFALFLILYGALRYIVEYYRVQPYGLFEFGIISMSHGQLLTIPIIVCGVLLYWRRGRRGSSV